MFFILSKEKIPSKLWPRLIKPSENQGLENPKSIKKTQIRSKTKMK